MWTTYITEIELPIKFQIIDSFVYNSSLYILDLNQHLTIIDLSLLQKSKEDINELIDNLEETKTVIKNVFSNNSIKELVLPYKLYNYHIEDTTMLGDYFNNYYGRLFIEENIIFLFSKSNLICFSIESLLQFNLLSLNEYNNQSINVLNLCLPISMIKISKLRYPKYIQIIIEINNGIYLLNIDSIKHFLVKEFIEKSADEKINYCEIGIHEGTILKLNNFVNKIMQSEIWYLSNLSELNILIQTSNETKNKILIKIIEKNKFSFKKKNNNLSFIDSTYFKFNY